MFVGWHSKTLDDLRRKFNESRAVQVVLYSLLALAVLVGVVWRATAQSASSPVVASP